MKGTWKHNDSKSDNVLSSRRAYSFQLSWNDLIYASLDNAPATNGYLCPVGLQKSYTSSVYATASSFNSKILGLFEINIATAPAPCVGSPPD